MIEIANPSIGMRRSINSFAKKNLGPESLAIFSLISSYSNSDAIVLNENEKTVGTGAVIRLDSENCALGCLMVKTRHDDQATQGMLIDSLVARARQTSRSFVSCIRSDKFPYQNVLEERGFKKLGIRAVFSGELPQVTNSQCVHLNIVEELITIIQNEFPVPFLNTCFRPVHVSSESLAALLAKGVIIQCPTETNDLALVSKAGCLIDAKGIKYMVPDYLLDKEIPNLKQVGEITLLSTRNTKQLLSGSCNWLSKLGIKYVNVYSHLADEVGYEIMKTGLDFQTRHEVWIGDLRGPLDTFVNS